jgi:glyoxylase-like metal-dependent hydrolase (beta-lactamase superfamily II)
VIELPLGPTRTVNTILIDGDPLTLVDTGLRSRESLAALEAGFARIGRCIEDLDQIVITHPHNDHFGAAAELVRRSGARVVGDGVAVMAGFPETFQGNARMRLELFDESGAPSEVARRWRERVDRFPWTADPVEAELELHEGDRVRMGDADWQVISTPGHAATSICLYQPAARLLIAGDMLIGNAGASVTLHEMARPGRWFLDIVESLAKLSQFEVDRAFPGHGPLIEDGQRVIAQRRMRALQRYEEVANLVAEAPRHAWGLSTLIYPPVVGETSLGLSQSVGYLEALEFEHRAESSVENGARVYRAR